MADQRRSLAALLALYADNSSGDISAQDGRDFILSTYVPQGVCDFRLGLEQDVPVSVTDQTGKSTIYVNSANKGNRLGIFDATSWTLWTPRPFALAGLTGLTSARNYDVFASFSTPTHSSTNTGTDIVTWSANPGWTTGTYVIVTSTGGGLTAGTHYWYNRVSATTGSFHTTLADAIAGSNKVDLTANITQTLIGIFADLGPTWNAGAGAGSDTARGTGAGSTALTTQDGTSVNAVDVTGSIGGGTIAAGCGLYLGTTRTTNTNTVEDSLTKRFTWNNFNAVNRPLIRIESTASWTYGSTTIRQANGSTSNQFELVAGLAGGMFAGDIVELLNPSGGGASYIGWGEDSTTAFSSVCVGAQSNVIAPGVSSLRKYVALGYHYYSWLEKTSGATNTFYGANDGINYGMTGEWAC